MLIVPGITTWFNANLNSVLTPVSNSGSQVSFKLGCSVVDLLGNQGDFEWINGNVDLIQPAISYSMTRKFVFFKL